MIPSTTLRNQKAKLASDYNELLKELTSPKLKSIGCYNIGETIGKGSYGKVKLGVHKLTCRPVAIKKIHKKHAPLMAREIYHHRQLNHPNIVALYEILSTETSIFIVSEHCRGDLLDALTVNKKFSPNTVRKWFLQLVDAIDYCHQRGIVHRDLKLENILLDEKDNVKICDFGFARQTDKNQLLKTFCGSLAYSAPELIQRQQYCGPATDIWSLGVILFTLLAGELPFDDDSEPVLQKKIVTLDYNIPNYFSSEVTHLINSMLKLNPNDRLLSHEIKQHPWLSQYQNQSQTHSTTITSAHPQHEEKLSNHLLSAGFNETVVQEMKTCHVGTLGTIWNMLMEKSLEESWMIDSFKSWFISKPKPKTTFTPPIVTAPFTDDKEDEFSSEDDDSTHSSPATSVEDEDEVKKLYPTERCNLSTTYSSSPRPSKVDLFISRSRLNVEDRQMRLRNRLENKIIIEEDEEE